MNLFGMPTYNGKYLRPNSSKPIAGISLNDAFKRTLKQAQVLDDYLIPGTPVKLVNGANAGNAGINLKPNVLYATKATSTTECSGFVVSSPTDVMEDGDAYAIPRKNQIVYVALKDSGCELYVACNGANLVDKTIGSSNLGWDDTNTRIDIATTSIFDIGMGQIMSSVVDGLAIKYDDTNKAVVTEDASVIKIKL